MFFKHSYVVSGIDTEYAEGLVWKPWCSWLCHREDLPLTPLQCLITAPANIARPAVICVHRSSGKLVEQSGPSENSMEQDAPQFTEEAEAGGLGVLGQLGIHREICVHITHTAACMCACAHAHIHTGLMRYVFVCTPPHMVEW